VYMNLDHMCKWSHGLDAYCRHHGVTRRSVEDGLRLVGFNWLERSDQRVGINDVVSVRYGKLAARPHVLKRRKERTTSTQKNRDRQEHGAAPTSLHKRRKERTTSTQKNRDRQEHGAAPTSLHTNGADTTGASRLTTWDSAAIHTSPSNFSAVSATSPSISAAISGINPFPWTWTSSELSVSACPAPTSNNWSSFATTSASCAAAINASTAMSASNFSTPTTISASCAWTLPEINDAMIMASHSLHVDYGPEIKVRQSSEELETMFANIGTEVGQSQLAPRELVPCGSMEIPPYVRHHQQTQPEMAQAQWAEVPAVPLTYEEPAQAQWAEVPALPTYEEPEVDTEMLVFPEPDTDWLHRCDYCGHSMLVSPHYPTGVCQQEHSLQTCTPAWL